MKPRTETRSELLLLQWWKHLTVLGKGSWEEKETSVVAQMLDQREKEKQCDDDTKHMKDVCQLREQHKNEEALELNRKDFDTRQELIYSDAIF